jgi:hypothetical protein
MVQAAFRSRLLHPAFQALAPYLLVGIFSAKPLAPKKKTPMRTSAEEDHFEEEKPAVGAGQAGAFSRDHPRLRNG